MHLLGRPHAALLIVSDQQLPARHNLANVAVIERPDETFYSPVTRMLRVLSTLQDASMRAKMPKTPGVNVSTPALLA